MFGHGLRGIQVFSAHAEVVPTFGFEAIEFAGILRARGGSSKQKRYCPTGLVYSPRTRR